MLKESLLKKSEEKRSKQTVFTKKISTHGTGAMLYVKRDPQKRPTENVKGDSFQRIGWKQI